MSKKIILSASTSSGDLTLGNYIGAINNWAKLQEDYDCYYMVADLHSLTTRHDPEVLKKRIISFYAQYIACGLDPNQNTLFVQSHVSAHAELCWVLNCMAPMGALNRMTQFKEKSQKTKEINNGLYTYPVLMAADILLYNTDLVPVGEDQKQHLELARDLAQSFNSRYGEIFKIPDPYISKKGARVMSLQNPENKMSKSDENSKSFISILDNPKLITKKIKSAVTDSDPNAVIKYDPENKKGLANLMTIHSVLSGESFEKIEKTFEGKMYGHLKLAVAELVCDLFEPVQAKYNDLMNNKDYISDMMQQGAERAQQRANKTIDDVYKAIGLVRL